MIKKYLKSALLSTPGWYPFDVLVSLAFFWVAHKRLPRRRSGLFNDYLFFFKLSDDLYGPLRQFVSDKVLVKHFYTALFGETCSPRTLGQVFDYEEFCRKTIPDRCVIKPSHLSGVIFYDRHHGGLSDTDRSKIKTWLKSNMYYDLSRERNYRYLKPSVFFEECIDDLASMKDYKIFCVDGHARAIHVHTGRHVEGGHRMSLYDREWNPVSLNFSKPAGDVEPKPALLAAMLAKAETIAKYFSFIRVDMYVSGDVILLGELTSVPGNAHDWMTSLEAERGFLKLLGLS